MTSSQHEPTQRIPNSNSSVSFRPHTDPTRLPDVESASRPNISSRLARRETDNTNPAQHAQPQGRSGRVPRRSRRSDRQGPTHVEMSCRGKSSARKHVEGAREEVKRRREERSSVDGRRGRNRGGRKGGRSRLGAHPQQGATSELRCERPCAWIVSDMTVAINEKRPVYSSVRRARPPHRPTTYRRRQLPRSAAPARPFDWYFARIQDMRGKSSVQTAASRSVFDAIDHSVARSSNQSVASRVAHLCSKTRKSDRASVPLRPSISLPHSLP